MKSLLLPVDPDKRIYACAVLRRGGVLICLLICLLMHSMTVGAAEETVEAQKKTETGQTAGDAAKQTQTAAKSRWQLLMDKYRDKKNTNRLIFVKYNGGTRCTVRMYKKVTKKNGKHKWKKILVCKGYVGRNGINKVREGDMKTPTGTFKIGEAFGILPDPGTKVKYTQLNEYLYWSGEYGTYNKMVDSRVLGHVPAGGEHLIRYKPHYNYALDMGYNKKCVFGKGSALFLHCFGTNTYTAGCVAVAEANMKFILQNITKKTRICIYPR